MLVFVVFHLFEGENLFSCYSKFICVFVVANTEEETAIY